MEQTSSIRSYCEEWQFLFENSSTRSFGEVLKQLGVRGSLQGSHFRSVCWKILLGCLSEDKMQWTSQTNCCRQSFTTLKSKYDVDPRRKFDAKLDLVANNPLAQEERSPWRQYFIDVELKCCIRQDVERTFPELAYFQSNDVREMMITILFVYARENPQISYKQGMHEILGPLIFVLYSDQQSLCHALEQEEFSNESDIERKQLICSLIHCKYLEHDAYQMFTYIMQIIQPWYYFGGEAQDSLVPNKNLVPIIEPFSRPQDTGPSSALIRKLNFIGDVLLQNADPILFSHLEKLEIPPQIYGIRWLRLLFGREFPIQDLLFLWDAIFAGGAPFLLVDYIFVAMLKFIRDLLLSCDYTGCLHYLMRYPPVADVHSLLALALHLQDPKKYSCPTLFARTNFSHITVAGRPHPNSSFSRNVEFVGKSVESTQTGEIRRVKLETTKNNVQSKSSTSSTRSSPEKVEEKNNRAAETKWKYRKTFNNGRERTLVSEEELELLKEQVSCLQVRLSEVETDNRLAAEKYKTLFDHLELRLNCLMIPKEDESRKLLADLRRVSLIKRSPVVSSAGFERIGSEKLQHHSTHNSATPTNIQLNTPIEIGNDPTLTMNSPTKNEKAPTTTTSAEVGQASKSTNSKNHKVVLNAENELQDLSRKMKK